MTCDRPNHFSIGEPPQTLDLGDTRTTSLGLRTSRFATVEAARALPGSALTWQQPPARVLAPRRRRPLRRLGEVWSHADITLPVSQ
jgi:hypothetical protein